ncbi:MAG: S9 family peptidase [Sphingomonadaceae bacterium]|nr:S9 family peptidase [Sphingomonadaceae bacterium]
MKLHRTALRGASMAALAMCGLGMASFSSTAVMAQAAAEPASHLADKRIPAGEFVKAGNMRTVRISPDGSKLAYVAGVEGKEILVVMDLATNKITPILPSTEARESGDREMRGYRWVGNDHVVVTIISREDLGSGLGDFRRLVAFNVKTREAIQQAWRNAGADAGVILHIDHDSGKYLLQRDSTAVSTERWGLPEVVEVDVATGDFKSVQRQNPIVRSWAADGKGEIRMGTSFDRDSGKIRLLYKGENDRNLKTVYNDKDETFTESLPAPRMFIPGTDMAYVVSNHEGVDKVYKMDVSTMDIVETVYETPGFDIQGIVTNEHGTKLLGYRIFDGTMKTVYTDPDLQVVQQLMEEMFGKDEGTIVDYTDDLSKVIVYGGGLTKAGAYYIFDTRSGQMQLLNWNRTNLKDAPLNPVKAEWYTASDGTKIQAIVTYPRHRKDVKNLPVVVMPHGGPFGALSATNANEPWSQPLAEQGYVVIQPNYRGSGGYGKDFVKIGRDPGGYGKRMQDDLNDILTYFGQKGVIDPNRACVMGWSYGGYAAARGAQRDPDVWKCAIAGAGVYDMPLMNKWDRVNLGKFSEGFQATSDDAEGISPARNTDGKWAPILIVTAKRDARIPMEQAETLVSNLKSSGKQEGKDFRYIVQEQGTHNLPYDDVHIQWIEEAHQWLEKYNPAYIASDPDKAPPLAVMN